MNKYIKIVIGSLIIFSIKTYAQQDPMFTQYMNNPQIINPAYAGTRGIPVLSGLFREQWVGIDGAPQTSAISFQSSIKRFGCGYGTHIIYDTNGPVKQTEIYLDYSFLINLGKHGTLSLGLNAGTHYYYVNYSDLDYNDPDVLIDISDPTSLFLPNFGVGSFYYNDRFYVGFSVPKLIQNTVDEESTDLSELSQEKLHWFLMAGTIFHLNSIVDFKPSFMTRMTQGAPLSLDVSGVFMINEKFWAGLTYRFGESIGGIARWQISPVLELGYSYDYSNSGFGEYNGGSHEILISYTFIHREKRILSPRYF